MIGKKQFYKQVKAATGVPEKYVKMIFGSMYDILAQNQKEGHSTRIVDGIIFKSVVHHNSLTIRHEDGTIEQRDTVVPKFVISKDNKKAFRKKLEG